MKQIVLSGTGGQGLILARDHPGGSSGAGRQTNAIETQSYGPEARGGASKAEVIISDDAIIYPKVLDADPVLLAMSREAFNKYGAGIGAAGSPDRGLDLRARAEGNTGQAGGAADHQGGEGRTPGRDMFANIIALGAIVGLTQTVSRESLVAAVLARVPKGTEDKEHPSDRYWIQTGKRGAISRRV